MAELVRFAGFPERRPTRAQRLAQEAEGQARRNIRREVMESTLRVDAIELFAEHVMDRAVDLDEYRGYRAGDDPLRNRLLAEIQATAYMQMRREQRGLFELD